MTWKISGILSRPVASQSSTGVSTGREQLLAADRVHLLADDLLDLAVDRQPSGRYVHSPALTWRMKPPRTSSLWLTRLRVGRILAQGRQEEL